MATGPNKIEEDTPHPPLSQQITVEQAESFIDWCIQRNKYTTLSRPQAQDLSYWVRFPDTTIFTDDVALELKARYLKAGWDNLEVQYGDSVQTEYQAHVKLTVFVKNL